VALISSSNIGYLCSVYKLKVSNYDLASHDEHMCEIGIALLEVAPGKARESQDGDIMAFIIHARTHTSEA
jgi:hypothetical protein